MLPYDGINTNTYQAPIPQSDCENHHFATQLLVNAAQWTHFIHYVLFLGAGAGLGKAFPIAFQISMSAVMGALMAGQ